MRRIRVMPTLLIDRDCRLVKTERFAGRTYIGDPINAVRIFNQKQVDELILLDIDAARERRPPSFDAIEDIVSEAFMPVAYGGGIRSLDDIVRLLRLGLEKVVLSTAAFEVPGLIGAAAERCGSQAIAVCLPAKRRLLGRYRTMTRSARTDTRLDVREAAMSAVEQGAGEIIVYSIDRDGTFQGFDIALLRRVSGAVDVPVVACGGAATLADVARAVRDGGCAAVAAGSMFVYQGPRRGVLITYPDTATLERQVYVELA